MLQLAGISCGPAPVVLPPLSAEISVPDIWYGVSTAPYQVEAPAVVPGQDGFFQTDWDLQAERVELPTPKGEATWELEAKGAAELYRVLIAGRGGVFEVGRGGQ